MGMTFNPLTGKFDIKGKTRPAGSDKQIQFNDGGLFGGDAGLTFDKATNTFKAGTEMLTVDDTSFTAGDPLALYTGSYFTYSTGTNLFSFIGVAGFRAFEIDLSGFSVIQGDPDALVGGFYGQFDPISYAFNIGIGLGSMSYDPYFQISTHQVRYLKDYAMSFESENGVIIAETSAQKMAFWGAQPVIRPDPASLADATHTTVGGTPVLNRDTFDIGGSKYTIRELFTLIFTLGLWKP